MKGSILNWVYLQRRALSSFMEDILNSTMIKQTSPHEGSRGKPGNSLENLFNFLASSSNFNHEILPFPCKVFIVIFLHFWLHMAYLLEGPSWQRLELDELALGKRNTVSFTKGESRISLYTLIPCFVKYKEMTYFKCLKVEETEFCNPEKLYTQYLKSFWHLKVEHVPLMWSRNCCTWSTENISWGRLFSIYIRWIYTTFMYTSVDSV